MTLDPASLRERQRAIREAAAAAKAAARAKVEGNPLVQDARQRRRRRRLLLLLLLALLLLLLSRCECGEAPPPPPPPPVVAQPSTPPPPPPPVKKKPPKKKLDAKIAKQDRGTFDPNAASKTPWLTEFRLQVAARSTRLAACFNGAERPGSWRWGVAVNAKAGTVADHVLEPVGWAAVTDEQQACVLTVLSEPRYKLPLDGVADVDAAVPQRVSLVFEF